MQELNQKFCQLKITKRPLKISGLLVLQNNSPIRITSCLYGFSLQDIISNNLSHINLNFLEDWLIFKHRVSANATCPVIVHNYIILSFQLKGRQTPRTVSMKKSHALLHGYYYSPKSDWTSTSSLLG